MEDAISEQFQQLVDPEEVNKCSNDSMSKGLLKNQKTILEAVKTISNNQVKISTHISELETKVGSLQTNSIEPADFLAQTKAVLEIKVLVRNIEKEVCRMTGEQVNKILTEITSMLPCSAYIDVMILEEKLKIKEYLKAMTSYVYKAKGVSNDLSDVFKKLFTDSSLMDFNWNGSSEKKSLKELTLFENVLRVVFHNMTSKEFEDAVRKEVRNSHHRVHQKAYDSKKIRTNLNNTI